MNFMSKKVVVTGGTGHIGQNLIKRLDDLNVDVIVLSRSSRNNDFLHTMFVRCDISKKESVEKIKKHLQNADYLIHLAAFVPKGRDDKLKSTNVNVLGSINLMTHIFKKTKVCYISTVEVYGKTIYLPIDEKHPCQPITYYGRSKLTAEKYLKLLLKKKGNDLIILRFASVFGPGEIIPRAIPNFIKCILENKNPIIYGDGSEKRDYLYIDDAVNAILLALKYGKNGTFNIASGRACTIKQIAENIINISNKKLKPIFKERKKQKHDFVFDISKAKKILGFRPKTKIEEGLKKEMIWHVLNKAKTIYIDLDGTLLDVSERLYRLHKDSISTFRFAQLQKEEYMKLKRQGMKEKEIIERKYNKNIFEKYNTIRLRNMEKKHYLDFDKMFFRNINILRELKKGQELILVTNRKSKSSFFKQFKKFNLDGLFDKVLFSRKEIVKDNSVIIGDTEEDVLTARKLNVPIIVVENGLRDKNFLIKYKPDFIVRKFSEIL